MENNIEIKNKALKQKAEKIYNAINLVQRESQAEKFINENANHLSLENQEKLKKVLVNFQDFLAKNEAELV